MSLIMIMHRFRVVVLVVSVVVVPIIIMDNTG
jgi:hypothetical protein